MVRTGREAILLYTILPPDVCVQGAAYLITELDKFSHICIYCLAGVFFTQIIINNSEDSTLVTTLDLHTIFCQKIAILHHRQTTIQCSLSLYYSGLLLIMNLLECSQ